MRAQTPAEDHYATLGLDRSCTARQIRDAYRLLAKRYHPDLNQNDTEAQTRIQALNAAYEILRDLARRRAYDRVLNQASQTAASRRGAKIERNITQEVRLRIDDFLRGKTIAVQVNDPANPSAPESYRVEIPPMTALGTRLRLRRSGLSGGFLQFRLKALPGYCFKVRGSDLRTELRISAQRAAQAAAK